VYDGIAKKSAFFGPLMMGICRAINLWMGFSIAANYLPVQYLWVPLLYILAVTAVSREEVKGATGSPQWFAAISYVLVLIGIGILTYLETGRLLWPAVFLFLWGVMIFRPLLQAMQTKTPDAVKKAVKAGVLGVVLMDGAWAAGYGPWWLPLMVLLLLPLSRVLAQRFSVT
jgi:4-hydroxybenzoate polyprenyltransferase